VWGEFFSGPSFFIWSQQQEEMKDLALRFVCVFASFTATGDEISLKLA
jgi:hypothetical protein